MQERRERRIRGWAAAWAAAAVWLVAGTSLGQQHEIALAEADYKKLDTFEALILGKADKAFAAKNYRGALADYDSFVTQYPRSPAVPYALLRKGRCLQIDEKRFDAIRVYNEVLDYFPNAINYAGAALFFIGECNWLNGDTPAAMKAWAEQAKDVDYRTHVLAAGAINQLADNLVRQDKWSEAVAYYRQVALDFRAVNPPESWRAIDRVLEYYVRVSPDEKKLREFYEAAHGFDRRQHATDDTDYWSRLMGEIDARATFAQGDTTSRENHYGAWAQAMDGKFPKWDDFQITQARFRLQADGNQAKWMASLDKQFADYQKEGDFRRIFKWIAAYRGHKAKIADYYSKLSFAKMSNAEIVDLTRTLYENADVEIARSAIGKLKHDLMNDDERERLAGWIGCRDPVGVKMVFDAMTDVPRGIMGIVRLYHKCRPPQPEKGLKAVEGVLGLPQYAKEAHFMKGSFHEQLRQWQPAISAYQSADDPPRTSYAIARCYLSDGRRDSAVGTLREIENFFPTESSKAALMIANVYRDTGEKKLYVKELRGIMTKYAGSGESSAAHQALEAMGYKIGGGLDADSEEELKMKR